MSELGRVNSWMEHNMRALLWKSKIAVGLQLLTRILNLLHLKRVWQKEKEAEMNKLKIN